MLVSLVFVSALAALVHADHRITLRNNCIFGIGLTLSNFPHQGVDYTGPAIGDIPAKTSKVAFVIVLRTLAVKMIASAEVCRSENSEFSSVTCLLIVAFGRAPCSMTEFTFDSPNINGQNDYDISNIQGFSVAQQIIPDGGCSTVTCTNVNCPCNQAYRPNDISGTCGGTGPVDQATRVCASSGYSIV
ncbi:hypothetical protein C8J57DRAFT_1588534 [Mycena rebaudengoi]|nr:hypothetical protein C8J57DRAFT_1588534 [Mycena rebaudengoi]